MDKIAFKLYPECHYLSSSNALVQNIVWIIVPGLLETPWTDVWIESYANSLNNFGWGIIAINPHWKQITNINDDVNAYHYQWQLSEILKEWFDLHNNKSNAFIGYIAFSQGGCQTINFLLDSPLVHNIIHNHSLNLWIGGPILLDPYPLENDDILKLCPIKNKRSIECIAPLLDKMLIYSVDGNARKIERLPIGLWTAELLGVSNKKNWLGNKILVTKNNVDHSDIPTSVLSDVLDYCQLLVKK